MGRITSALILINIAVFLLVFSMPEAMMENTFSTFQFSSSGFLEVWRWLTSMFLHASASHIFFNMLALYFFGNAIEDEIGARRFLLIYFLSGVAGNLAYGLTSAVPAVGASGCIFGIMGAAMLMKPKEMINMYVFPLPLGVIAMLYVLTQAALAAVPVNEMGIAYMAHIGGLAAGSLIMLYSEPKNSAKGVLVLAGLGILMLVLWPFVGLLVGIGQLVLGFFDFVVGIVLYGTAKLLLSWLW